MLPSPSNYQPRRLFSNEKTSHMTRSQFKPKAFAVYYRQDGTGRDTFVKYNNGGLSAAQPASFVRPSQSTLLIRKIRRAPSPVIHAKPVHYVCDGTGRDNYVHVNSGGMTSYGTNKDSRTAFKESLRQYDRQPANSFLKLGGTQVGFRKTASLTSFKTLNQPGKMSLQRNDPFSKSQLHFNTNYYETQNALSKYQRQLDDRLSTPKTRKLKIVVKKEIPNRPATSATSYLSRMQQNSKTIEYKRLTKI